MSNTERIYEVEEIRGLRQSGTRQEWHVRPGGCRFGKEGQRVIAQYELPGLCLSAEASHPLLTQSYCGPAKLATNLPVLWREHQTLLRGRKQATLSPSGPSREAQFAQTRLSTR